MLAAGEKMAAYRFEGYWKDVGTLDSLWDANMDMLAPGSGLNLLDRRWPIYSRTPSCPPAFVGPDADVGNSAIAKGCDVRGEVKNSVLSYDTTIGEGASVAYSVLMPGAVVEPGAVVQYAIVGRKVPHRALCAGRRAAGERGGSRQLGHRRAGAGDGRGRGRGRAAEGHARPASRGGGSMNGMHGIIFSYEKQTQLRELIEHRVHGSIPFAGDYRVVDFALSSMVNAGVRDVGVIMHGKCQSMMDHLRAGKSWDLSRNHGGLTLLPAFAYRERGGGDGSFRGRVEALACVMDYLRGIRQEYVVLSDSDLVANLPLRDVLHAHIETGADVTAVCTPQPGACARHLLSARRDRAHHGHGDVSARARGLSPPERVHPADGAAAPYRGGVRGAQPA